jgi:comEA protein
MQGIEKAISLIIFSVLTSCLGISYSLKINQGIAEYAPAQIVDITSGYEQIARARIVNINTANRYQLASLSGIGPRLAERIIEYRDTHGLFSSREEIMRVKGIGSKKYRVIYSWIAVND